MASTAYLALIGAAEEFLRNTNSKDADYAKTNKEIVQAIRKKVSDGTLSIDVTDGTMLSYLSQAANYDSNSAIVSGGPRGGYWYDESEKSQPEAKPIEKEELTAERGNQVTVLGV